MTFQMVGTGESFWALLAGERFRRRFVVFVSGEDVSSKVVLLRKLLAALCAVERPDFFVHGGHVLLQVVLPREAVLADVALPISPFLFFRFAVFAELDCVQVPGHDPVPACHGIAQADAAVLVLAVQGGGVEFVFFLGGAGHLVNCRNVSLQ